EQEAAGSNPVTPIFATPYLLAIYHSLILLAFLHLLILWQFGALTFAKAGVAFLQRLERQLGRVLHKKSPGRKPKDKQE
ncbi:MAG: hypothetical protein AAB403_19520, partial [Planctomycetota bacterium]